MQHTLVAYVEDKPGVSKPGQLIVSPPGFQYRIADSRAYRKTWRFPDDDCGRQQPDQRRTRLPPICISWLTSSRSKTWRSYPMVSRDLALIKVSANPESTAAKSCNWSKYTARASWMSPTNP